MRLTRIHKVLIAVFALAAAMPGGALAQTETGPETGLPMPRFVSLKAPTAYVRRGPSRKHRIDWEYVRRGMPLQVVAEYDNWRRVRDMEGMGGWIHFTLISGVRTVIVLPEEVTLRDAPETGADPVARVRSGVIARLETCAGGWCEISKDGHDGWVPADALWGVTEEERSAG